MGPVDFYKFVKELITNWDAEHIAALVTGVFVAVVILVPLWFSLRRLLFGKRESAWKERFNLEQGKVELLSKTVENQDTEIECLQEKVRQLSRQCEELQEAGVDLESATAELTTRLETARTEKKSLVKKANAIIIHFKSRVEVLEEQSQQIQKVNALEGKVWQKAAGTPPPFRDWNDSAATIVAVVNLKGGVGKTTLTANLGATMARKGDRVLMVDLDYQGSLTSLCLSAEQIKDLRPGGGRFVQNLFKAASDHVETAWNSLSSFGNGLGAFLAASEELADVEEHAKARWLLGADRSSDVRYLLRQVLHHPMFQERFDWILLDCPPRLTTASINALACCDQVLIPVLLDKMSADSVPRMLTWLRDLKAREICPNLSLLGVVANRTRNAKRLMPREKDVWVELQEKCVDEWRGPVTHFARFVPNRVGVAAAAAQHAFVAFDDDFESIFLDLDREIRKKVSDDSARPATVR